jgi:bifunctional non-homologous end joining protein LigD
VPIAPIDPMLATAGQLDARHEWAVEPKLDGWRALVYVDGGLCVRTRTGRVVTENVPQLGPVVDVLPDGSVLDGELVAGQGRASDFYKLGPQLARRRGAQAVTFAASDLLHLAGESTLSLTWQQRRRLLELLEVEGPAWCTLPVFTDTAEVVLRACEQHQLEGLVAKRVDSTYQPGKRTRSWVKVKTTDWREMHAPMRHERVR